jgi:hypothetical protein
MNGFEQAFEAAAGKVVADAAIRISKALAKNVDKLAAPLINKAAVALQVGFKEYLEQSYRRCSKFKTILTPDEPLSVMDHYVNVNLSCRIDGLAHLIQRHGRDSVAGVA